MYLMLLFPVAVFWWEGERFTPMAFLVFWVGLALAGQFQNVLDLLRAVHEGQDPDFYKAVREHNDEIQESRRQQYQARGLPAARTLARAMVWWEGERPAFLRFVLLAGLAFAVLSVMAALR